MKHRIIAILTVFVLCFPFVSVAAEQPERETMTVPQIVASLEGGGKWLVTQKEGEITKFVKNEEGWFVDYRIKNTHVLSVLGALDPHNAYIIKADKDQNIQYAVGSEAMTSMNDNGFQDTKVLDAVLVVSWPELPDKLGMAEGDQVILLFVRPNPDAPASQEREASLDLKQG